MSKRIMLSKTLILMLLSLVIGSILGGLVPQHGHVAAATMWGNVTAAITYMSSHFEQFDEQNKEFIWNFSDSSDLDMANEFISSVLEVERLREQYNDATVLTLVTKSLELQDSNGDLKVIDDAEKAANLVVDNFFRNEDFLRSSFEGVFQSLVDQGVFDVVTAANVKSELVNYLLDVGESWHDSLETHVDWQTLDLDTSTADAAKYPTLAQVAVTFRIAFSLYDAVNVLSKHVLILNDLYHSNAVLEVVKKHELSVQLVRAGIDFAGSIISKYMADAAATKGAVAIGAASASVAGPFAIAVGIVTYLVIFKAVAEITDAAIHWVAEEVLDFDQPCYELLEEAGICISRLLWAVQIIGLYDERSDCFIPWDSGAEGEDVCIWLKNVGIKTLNVRATPTSTPQGWEIKADLINNYKQINNLKPGEFTFSQLSFHVNSGVVQYDPIWPFNPTWIAGENPGLLRFEVLHDASPVWWDIFDLGNKPLGTAEDLLFNALTSDIYSVHIISPLSSEPVYVGDPGHPTQFNAKVITGAPLHLGIPGNFIAKINDRPAKVSVVSSPVDLENGSYMLQITPPIQDTEGHYDLEISQTLGNETMCSDVESDSVIYATSNVDVIEVIDRSPSMAWYGDVIHSSEGILSSNWVKIDTFQIDPSVTAFDVVLESENNDSQINSQIRSPSGDWYGFNLTSAYSVTDYSHNTYIRYTAGAYIRICESSSVEDGTWEVWSIGTNGNHYALAVQVPPIRINAAKSAAEFFVDTMNAYDEVGVVSFAGDTSLNKALILLDTSQNVDTVKSTIDSLVAGGSGTALGDGIYRAIQELSSVRHRLDAAPAIILFTDGVWAGGSDPIVRAQEAKNAGIKIYAIGLGRVNHSVLSEIASTTGGEYLYAPSTSELESLYLSMAAFVGGKSTILSDSGTIQEGETTEQKATIDSNVSSATFSINWGGSDLDLTLVCPDGSMVDPTIAATDPNIRYTNAATYEIYEVKLPMQGEWTMRVFAAEATGVEGYSATVLATTNLTLQVYTDKDEYRLSEPVKLTAIVTKDGDPITDAAVKATIERPDRTTDLLWLYDDGTHDDGGASDGVYANYYNNTTISGSYSIEIQASGTWGEEPFVREARQSIHVTEVISPGIAVTPVSWDAGNVSTSYDTVCIYTLASTSTANEIVNITASAFTNGSGNLISSDNFMAVPSICTVPSGNSTQFSVGIHIPTGTPPGKYAGNIMLVSTLNSLAVPVSIDVVDVVPPAKVTDLATSNPTFDSATLTWTAPGDDGIIDIATTYDIRYSTSWITEENWALAIQCTAETSPKPAGDSESYIATGLSPGISYYFALRTADKIPNWSELSNIVSISTSSQPESTTVTGTTREVNGNILAGVTITLDGIGPVVSDQNGQFQMMATATGSHTIVAHKDGFRDRTQTVNIAGLVPEFAVTCNFQGTHGLIPNAPDIWYALDCVNLWLYPPNQETGLDIWTALDVINAWLYPISE